MGVNSVDRDKPIVDRSVDGDKPIVVDGDKPIVKATE